MTQRAARAQLTAPGYRGNGTNDRLGTLVVVGSDGYSWASTAIDYRSMYLHFQTTGLVSGSITSRAYGLQLRCLSE
ncbi:hypothetical protein [uncultured Rikenella sp.]|uniref:hypothetical protein n=1 Tax=uncultured Rikenella sp. TaxID=368003 RepID=UPI002627326A|nr:hypothetical protein [uncultured Rikenella sp.]